MESTMLSDKRSPPSSNGGRSDSKMGGGAKEASQGDDDDSNSSSDLLVAIRSQHDPVMALLYSFLSVKDRVHLSQVDKGFSLHFHEHHRVVGVYGPHDLEIEQAFEKVCEYLKFQGTPASLRFDLIRHVPSCWIPFLGESNVRELPQWMHDFVRSRYDETIGYYNLDGLNQQETENELAQEDHDGLDEAERDSRVQVLEVLEGVNSFRRETHFKLENVRAGIRDILASSSDGDRATPCSGGAPYNALFDLFTKHDIATEPFLTAKHPFDDRRFNRNVFGIIHNGNLKFLEHLRPAHKLVYRGEDDGNMSTQGGGVVKECDTCNKVREDVHTESCGNEVRSFHCFHQVCVCEDCTTKTTCSTCGVVRCNQPVCSLRNRVESCCVTGCNNRMCFPPNPVPSPLHPDYADDWDEQTSCIFVMPRSYNVHDPAAPAAVFNAFYPPQLEGQEAHKYFCLEHKPDGAVPFPPSEIAFHRMRQTQPIFM